MSRLVIAKPASMCKYGDWRDNVDWKAVRILLPIVVVVISLWAFFFIGG